MTLVIMAACVHTYKVVITRYKYCSDLFRTVSEKCVARRFLNTAREHGWCEPSLTAACIGLVPCAAADAVCHRHPTELMSFKSAVLQCADG